MREIKFKGKGPFGWRIGQLLKINDGYYVIIQNIHKYKNGTQYPEDSVYPETIGQYTGVKDIHGTEIYEGDTVEYDILFRGKVSRTDRGKVVFRSAQFFIEGGGPLTQPSDCCNLRVISTEDVQEPKFIGPFHLNIIDNNVALPSDIDKEYENPEEAYKILGDFVHSFDGKMQVDGRVCDSKGDDWDYSSSILN